MTAIQALCNAGGTVRITVFRAHFRSPAVEILANVIVSCTALDKAELIPVNIFTVKGMLKQFPASGRFYLDFKNFKDPDYPNFWFGSGFADYISAYTIRRMLDLIPENSTGRQSRKFIEFRVLEDGSIENVDIHNAYKQKRKNIAETIVKIVDGQRYMEEIEGEQIEIESVIGVNEEDNVLIDR